MALDSTPESNLFNFEDDDLYDPVFIFVTEREHNFQKSENIAFTFHLERKKKIYLNSNRYFLVYVSLV